MGVCRFRHYGAERADCADFVVVRNSSLDRLDKM